jgi:hypothetical protein
VGADEVTLTPDDEAVTELHSFCAEHDTELAAMLPNRRTQTNAVRRCTALLPAFEYLSRRASRQPLALVEVGPSAGLNLCWDRYGYEYVDERTGKAISTVYGDASSPVRLTTDVRGVRSPPLPERPTELPAVASRVGLDRNPLDVTDHEDVTWLRSLIWPEHSERHALLRSAIAVAKDDPPRLRTGDVLETLTCAIDEVPRETPVVVFDTQVRYQFDGAMDAQYRELIRKIGAERDLHWLSGNEAVSGADNGLWLNHATVEDGRLREQRLAAYQQHGLWLEWVAES